MIYGIVLLVILPVIVNILYMKRYFAKKDFNVILISLAYAFAIMPGLSFIAMLFILAASIN